MGLHVVEGDIVTMDTEVIVNAANTKLKKGGGVCGAIFEAAGAEELQKECDLFQGCPIGYAVITQGYKLKAKYIIHTVGPVWQGGNMGEELLLGSCYRKSLELADRYGLESIAFPLISSGIFGYPYEEAKKVAEETIEAYLLEHPHMEVYLVLKG